MDWIWIDLLNIRGVIRSDPTPIKLNGFRYEFRPIRSESDPLTILCVPNQGMWVKYIYTVMDRPTSKTLLTYSIKKQKGKAVIDRQNSTTVVEG